MRILNAAGYRMSLVLIFGLLCVVEAYGQPDVKISNTAKQIKPGVFECILYVEVTKEVSKTIDDVTFTLPPGYSNRKQRAVKLLSGMNIRFSSKPFITTEEVEVNVLVDFKGPNDRYSNYRLVLFSRK